MWVRAHASVCSTDAATMGLHEVLRYTGLHNSIPTQAVSSMRTHTQTHMQSFKEKCFGGFCLDKTNCGFRWARHTFKTPRALYQRWKHQEQLLNQNSKGPNHTIDWNVPVQSISFLLQATIATSFSKVQMQVDACDWWATWRKIYSTTKNMVSTCKTGAIFTNIFE